MPDKIIIKCIKEKVEVTSIIKKTIKFSIK